MAAAAISIGTALMAEAVALQGQSGRLDKGGEGRASEVAECRVIDMRRCGIPRVAGCSETWKRWAAVAAAAAVRGVVCATGREAGQEM